ncbi:MAG TPA: hypothetical protein VGG74_11595 [Kofleriaceae bacterium]|jgi:hypothetical protein
MKKVIVILLVLCGVASAHVGSPDVFFEGDAGPYKLFVTVRAPKVIPGVAEIEIRSESPDVEGLTVVPMRLTGPGSELPPAPDRAARSVADRQFFTASVWLMEHGSLQVRIAATGARGPGTLSVPVPAFAQTTLAMPRGLGTLLFALMLLLALSIVAIVIAAVREGALPPGEAPPPRRGRLALVVVAAIVAGAIVLGNHWWTSVARDYAQMVDKPWHVGVTVDGCQLTIHDADFGVLPDHGHEMHLFLVRAPALDHLAHLHPLHNLDEFVQSLPSLPAGHYKLYADVVMPSGFPVTGTAELDLPELHCVAPTGDDMVWASGDRASVVWDRPAQLRAGIAMPLAFHVEPADGLEPYMGMVAHAEIMRTDGSVFAHLHPNGSVAMPALELAQRGQMSGMGSMDAMPGMATPNEPLSPKFTIPFGFPQPGDYRVFVQIKRHGAVETAAFDAHVD